MTEMGKSNSRLSLPNMLFRRESSKSSLSSTESEKFDNLSQYQKDMFDNLDGKDGQKDGKINKKSLQDMLKAISKSSSLSLKTSIISDETQFRIQRQISQADQDKDGEINREEFAVLMDNIEENDEDFGITIKDHIDTAAHAVECKLWPPPIFLAIISIIQLSFFIYHVVHLQEDHNMAIFWTGPAPLCSVMIFSPDKRGQVWRFVTYAMVHSGISHVILNIVLQLAVGLPLEMTHGSSRIAAIYMSGVLAGSLATSCFNPHVYLAGASSGGYALIAAHVSNLILNWKEEDFITCTGFKGTALATHAGLLKVLKLTATLAYIVGDIIVSVYSHDTYGSQNTTAYTAHLAGAASGLVVGLLVLHNIRVNTHEIWIKLGCYLVTCVFLGLTILWQLTGDSVHRAIHQGEMYFSPQTEGYGHDVCAFYNTTILKWENMPN